MNKEWETFLLAQGAKFNDDSDIDFAATNEKTINFICALPHLTILAVSGKDAAQFLQGQITCNVIQDVNDNCCSFAALCNAKGRSICTFLIIKKADVFYLILPATLSEIVAKRLQMFILRSDVSITEASDEFCILGLGSKEPIDNFPQQIFNTIENEGLIVKYPSNINRYLVLKKVEQSIQFWSRFIETKKFVPTGNSYWKELEILDGIPWLTKETSEEFIPQMLNLDLLKAINFKKGCYTGQEIIARTHFLGKTKRKMYFANTQTNVEISPNDAIYEVDKNNKQSIGKILNFVLKNGEYMMLVIAQTESAASGKIILENQAELPLSDLTYSYLN
jgi:folate-binding protein YgfZ